MNPIRFQRLMRRELALLRREELLEPEQYERLVQRYPTQNWDWLALGRWFAIFGAVSAAAGLLLLAGEIFAPTLENLAIGLSILVVALFVGAWKLGRRSLLWSRRAVELLACIAVIGLTFTLGMIFSSGSGNWPMLLLIDLLVVVPLAYWLRNPLLLILSVIVFFVWFGGVTGYVSGWGAYFFGMNYPVRFLLVGCLMIAFAAAHRLAETTTLQRYDGFFKVWLSGGMFFSEMALWLTSLFGNFGEIFSRHDESAFELVAFNLLWLGFNAGALYCGARFGSRMLRGYAITFFIIQGYTLFFWRVAGHLGGVMSTFIAGMATLALVAYLENARRDRRDTALTDPS